MVAAYSPHRHHGDSTAFFSRPHSRSPSRSLLHSPSACPSPFAISLAAAAAGKTRSSGRRSTPIKTRPLVHPGSPVKFPLRLAASSIVNKSPRLMSRRSSSPPDKRDIGANGLEGSPSDDGSVEHPAAGSGSPLSRSEGMMDLDRVSRGSPVAKRRPGGSGALQTTRGRQHVFGSPSLGGATTATRPVPSPERGSDFPKPRIPMKTASGAIRRVASHQALNSNRESPFNNYRHAALSNASAHARNNVSQPLQHSADSFAENETTSDSWSTPQNFKFAKPDPAAFYSTGFVPKRGRHLNVDGDAPHQQPDTPCKKNPKASGFSSSVFSSAFHQRVSGPRVPFWNLQTPGSENREGGLGLRPSRKNSFTSNDDSEESLEYGKEMQLRNDIDIPPTPTRRAPADARKGYAVLFSGTKRLRTETSSDGLGGLVYPPHTPNNSIMPPDPSSLSISGNSRSKRHTLPATPSPDVFGQYHSFSSPTPSDSSQSPGPPAATWMSRFVVEHIGTGQFSEVFKATERQSMQHTKFNPDSQLATPSRSSSFGSPSTRSPLSPKTYAVKQLKEQFRGPKDRHNKYEEVRILKELSQHDNIIEYFDSWEEDSRLYIATEFCENGGLDEFLWRHGEKGRLDEFRVWKVMLELCFGLEHIHKSGFLHLDLKPANVLIAFDGTLKISDFGLALPYPAPADIEREGDREYIAPEVLARNAYDRPVDVFSLGLTMIETAGNQRLPPNGHEWQQLRAGDITVAPILSTSSSGEFVYRDEEGNPVATELIQESDQISPLSPDHSQHSTSFSRNSTNRHLLHEPRPGDRYDPPKFMQERGLETLVKWMISADPAERPTITQLLATNELRWIDNHRLSSATIFEGLWGPDDNDEEDELKQRPEDEDCEMEQ